MTMPGLLRENRYAFEEVRHPTGVTASDMSQEVTSHSSIMRTALATLTFMTVGDGKLVGAHTSRIERRRRSEHDWERFTSEGVLSTDLREEIACSWKRSRDLYGIDPTAQRPMLVASEDALEHRRRYDELLPIAELILRDFSDRLCLRDHVLSYFDGEGWLLSINGDDRVVESLEHISFRVGANWSESSAGTNGPGTALALCRPVEVFAAEHFVAAWQAYSCAAAPVLSYDGSVAGLVDLTGPWEVRRRQAMFIVKAIARAVEERYRAAQAVRTEVIRYAIEAAQANCDALIALDQFGQPIKANSNAHRHVLLRGTLPPSLNAAVARALDRPEIADSPIELTAPDGTRGVLSSVRYEGSTIGAVLRVEAPASCHRAHRRARPRLRYGFADIIGTSKLMQDALTLARRASENDLAIVLSGESGTGKELFAQAIHGASARRSGPFVAINCGSIPAELLEAELFGYEAGTFTGARRDGKSGRFEDANGGTLLLDEVSELSSSAQVALLRILQEQEITRLGSSTPRPVDVRVLAATNKPLEEALGRGEFRKDLYYRLAVLTITIPPLRDRGDNDVLALAYHFLKESGAELDLEDDAVTALCAHPWPGNVRELRNAMLRITATVHDRPVCATDLRLSPFTFEEPTKSPVTGSFKQTVATLERASLVEALEACEWNYARAARHLGLSRMTLYRWSKRYGIKRPRSDT